MKEEGPPLPASAAFCPRPGWRAGRGNAGNASQPRKDAPSQPIPVPAPRIWIPVPMPHLHQATTFPSSLALFQERVCTVVFPHAVVARKK